MDALPLSWLAAIAQIEQGLARRVVVIGSTDVGKSSFIRAGIDAVTAVGLPLPLIDLDPGQKMVGPPGTAALRAGRVERLVFIGSTSASEVAMIVSAASSLAASAKDGFIVNTAGFVRGLGARLQSMTIAALQPDLIVALGGEEPLKPILDAHSDVAIVRIERAPFARRKSPSERARIRQAAFSAAMEVSEEVVLLSDALSFTPGRPAAFLDVARPVCALATTDGTVASVGILQEVGENTVVWAKPPLSAVTVVQLGKMSAEPTPAGWKLLEQLRPTWQQESPL
jgi:polynucleotide 5'-kinase involved in rRNA processing